MKKLKRITLIALIIFFILLQSNVKAFNIQMKTDNSTVYVEDEFIYTINLNEKVVASNFLIDYDSTAFKLIGSNTTGLQVSEKDGKIACIYADIGGVGTDKFEIKFKALKESEKTKEFSLSETKFREVGKETSYTDTDIGGIDSKTTVVVKKRAETNDDKKNDTNVDNQIKQNTTKDTTTKDTSNSKRDQTVSDKNIPKAGKTFILLVTIGIIAILGIINKIKANQLKDI